MQATLMSIFKNFIVHKTKELTVNIKNRWTQLFLRTKHTKRFYKNPSDYNNNLLNNQANQAALLSKRKKKLKWVLY